MGWIWKQAPSEGSVPTPRSSHAVIAAQVIGCLHPEGYRHTAMQLPPSARTTELVLNATHLWNHYKELVRPDR